MKAQFEKIGSNQNALHAFEYKNERFTAPWHYHPEYELTYIVEGEGMRYIGNSIQKFGKGDFVLLGPNLPHCWKNISPQVDSVRSFVFQWNDQLLGDKWILKDEFYNIKKLLDKASKGVRFPSIVDDNIREQLENIIEKSKLDKVLSFTYLLEELSNIEDIELLTTKGFSANLNTVANQRIALIYDYVELNYQKKIKLSDISILVSMGNEAFCRFFKKSLNKSFFTFINEYRINLASKMLIETNRQVSQIAYDCGYESLPFFYRQFQKYMNCSPLVFRKNYLNVKTN